MIEKRRICDEKSGVSCDIMHTVATEITHEFLLYYKEESKSMSITKSASVGDRIKALRESRGLSQKDMSDEFVITGRSTLANYELGLRDIPVSILLLYSQKFNVSTDWILQGEISSGNSERDELVRAYSSINNEVVKKAVLRQIEGLECF